MILLVFISIVAWRVYKTAQEAGRNTILWSVGTVGMFLGIRFLIEFLLDVSLASFIEILGLSDKILTTYSTVPGFFGFVFGGTAVLLVLRHLNKVVIEKIYIAAPPPPPKFDE